MWLACPPRRNDIRTEAHHGCLPGPVGKVVGEGALQLVHHLLRRGLGPPLAAGLSAALLPLLPAAFDLGQLLLPPQLLHGLQGAEDQGGLAVNGRPGRKEQPRTRSQGPLRSVEIRPFCKQRSIS